jgi:molybdopterin molybdotransferase
MKNLSVHEARRLMLEKAQRLGSERVELAAAHGRVLAKSVIANRDQPPFFAAAMDGYAMQSSDLSPTGAVLLVIGESAAGGGFDRPVAAGQCVRIFTGAPLPRDCDLVIVQESVRREGNLARMPADIGTSRHIRPQGGDYLQGTVLLTPGERLDAWRLSLAASAGAAVLDVARRPRVAVLSTGDELVEPGQVPQPNQIYNSGSHAICALVETWGAQALRLHCAADKIEDITAAVSGLDVDLILTLGGASVGDHDLVKPAMVILGLDLMVQTIAIRPGKPTWFGKLQDGRRVLGLPGNPASALVCAQLFLRPLIQAMLGQQPGPDIETAHLASALPALGTSGGPREHWSRADLETRQGQLWVRPFRDQDSSLVTVFAEARALMRQEANGEGLDQGAIVEIVRLDRL